MSISIDTVNPGINSSFVYFTTSGLGNVESPPLVKYAYVSDPNNFLGDGVYESPLVIMGISAEVYLVVSDPELGNVYSVPFSATPYYLGSAPVIDSVVPGQNSLTVSFHQDVLSNSTPMYYYTLDGTTRYGFGVESSPLVIDNISGEKTFRIIASNVAGDVFSEPYTSTPYYIGTKPVVAFVEPMPNALRVTYYQDDMGNLPAVYYYSLDGTTLLGNGSEIGFVDILDISATTSFQIVASNSSGNVFSDVSSGTPLYVGSKPAIDSVVPGLNTLTVYFSQTNAGNLPAVYYYSLDGTTLLGNSVISSPLVISDISEEKTFQIVASNLSGNVFSDASSGTPFYVGSAPVISSTNFEDPNTNMVTVAFTQSNVGNPAATYYFSSDGITPYEVTSPFSFDASNPTTFLIVASNSAGNVSSDSAQVFPQPPPDNGGGGGGPTNSMGSAPIIDSVTADVESLIISWHQDVLGFPSPSYFYSFDGNQNDGFINSNPFTISGLTAYTEFYVVASNSSGNVSSAIGSGTPLSQPPPSDTLGSAPVIDSIVPGVGSLTVTWHQDVLGSPSPVYYYSFDGVTNDGSVTTSPFTISGLTTTKSVYVIASNAAGTVSSVAVDGTPLSPPPSNTLGSAPVIDSIASGVNTLTVYFHQDNLGTPSPTYYYSADGVNASGAGVLSSPLTITGVSGETPIYVIAQNSAGNVVSDLSSGLPLYKGSAPVIDSVTPGINSLTVAFHQDTSGNPSSTYYYSSDGVNASGAGVSSSPLTITGVSGETPIYVIAQNSAGNVVSDLSSGLPLFLGSAPVIDSVTPGINSLTVAFHQDTLGNPASTYYYSSDGVNASGAGVSSSPLIITGLSGSTPVYVIAQNSVGNLVSGLSSGLPLYKGSAPVIDSVVSGVDSLTVAFHQDTLGNPASTYYYSLDGVALLGTGVSSSPLTISNVQGTQEFYIVASNSAGNQFSSRSTGTTKEPVVPCFGENAKILCFNSQKCREEYVAIQNIRKGDLVKTVSNGYIPVNMIGKTSLVNVYGDNKRHKNRLYRLSKCQYPEMTEEDLILTGCHSILVDEFKNDEEREKTIKVNGDVFITDDYYRLPACVDERAKVYEKSGRFTIYHLALDNPDYYMNYGIYANGLLVETSSKRYMRELSKMTLL